MDARAHVELEQETTDALAATLTGELGPASSVRPDVPDQSGVRPFRVALGVMTLLIAAVALAHLALIAPPTRPPAH